MFRNKTASQHNFATVPRADIPRSRFPMRQTRKQAFNASELIPIMCEEVLPGDTWQHRESLLARLATPIAPLMDDLDIETFYFFVPNRILWPHWEAFITGADTDIEIPVTAGYDTVGLAPGVVVGSVFDQLGIPVQQYTTGNNKLTVFPFWGYLTIWNEWFRDQNLQQPFEWDAETWTEAYQTDIEQDGTPWDGMPLRVNKRHDYFTSSLPWPQKGDPIQISLGGFAPVVTGPEHSTGASPGGAMTMRNTDGTLPGTAVPIVLSAAGNVYGATGSPGAFNANLYPTNLRTDLAQATAITINAMRLAFQTQRLLERDARGGSRYVEQLISHWGVRSPDYRLQRPEYLGGSKIPIAINPIPQTAQYTAEPGLAESAVGNLGAEMHASGSKNSFTYAATEHGYILGVAVVRATPTYQQGTRRHWKRRTRLDYYFPVFAMLGEQAVQTSEIFTTDDSTYNNAIWGYQEHWAEYRYTPNEITGQLRSTTAQPMDWWHLSEEFANEPALNGAFIEDKTQEVLARCLATAPSEQWSAQIIMDILHESNVARLMPTYSVPGLIDHF